MGSNLSKIKSPWMSTVQASKPDLMARGVALDLLQMAKRVGPQYEAAEYEDLPGEENLTLDRIIADV